MVVVVEVVVVPRRLPFTHVLHVQTHVGVCFTCIQTNAVLLFMCKALTMQPHMADHPACDEHATPQAPQQNAPVILRMGNHRYSGAAGVCPNSYKHIRTRNKNANSKNNESE